MSVKIKSALLQGMLDAAVDTDGPLDVANLEVGLFTDPNLNLNGDLTEESFTAPAGVTGLEPATSVTLHSTWVDNGGAWHVSFDDIQFTAASVTSTEVCYGYYVYNTAISAVLFAEHLNTPAIFDVEAKSLILSPEVKLDPSSDFGSATAIS